MVPYNLEYLQEIGSGNIAFVKSVIELFLKESPENISNLNNAVNGKDYAAAKQHAHKLKSSLRALGAEVPATISAEIEAAALAKNNDALKALINKLNPALQELTNSLNAYIAK